jgi:hypothetical protein
VGVLGFFCNPERNEGTLSEQNRQGSSMRDDKLSSRLEIGEIAAAMISGSIRPSLGARMLVPHLHSLEKEVDSDIFRLFQGVDSESDALPIGPERKYWAPEALREKDEQANAYEMRLCGQLLKAAEYLVRRFPEASSSLP